MRAERPHHLLSSLVALTGKRGKAEFMTAVFTKNAAALEGISLGCPGSTDEALRSPATVTNECPIPRCINSLWIVLVLVRTAARFRWCCHQHRRARPSQRAAPDILAISLQAVAALRAPSL
jgi:hypothetical protein